MGGAVAKTREGGRRAFIARRLAVALPRAPYRRPLTRALSVLLQPPPETFSATVLSPNPRCLAKAFDAGPSLLLAAPLATVTAVRALVPVAVPQSCSWGS